MKSLAFAVATAFLLASPALAQEKKDAAETEEKKEDKKKETPSAADLALAKKLESQKMTFKLDGTPFVEVVDMLRDLSQIDFVVDPCARDVIDAESLTVTFNGENVTLGDCVSSIVKKSSENLGYEVWKGVVWVGSKASLEKKPEKPSFDDETKKKLDAKVKLRDTDETLADVMKSLNTQSKIKFSAADKIDASQVKVGIGLKDAKLTDVIEIVCRLLHYSAEGKDGEVVFSPAKSK